MRAQLAPRRPVHRAFTGVELDQLEGMWVHPWLRAWLLLLMLLRTHCDAETWRLIHPRLGKLLREERPSIRRAGWFN